MLKGILAFWGPELMTVIKHEMIHVKKLKMSYYECGPGSLRVLCCEEHGCQCC